MTGLRSSLQALLLKYGDNGHTGDPFYNEVRRAVEAVAVKKAPERKIFYDYHERMWHGITEADIEFWKDSFDGVDVWGELKKMKVWLSAHPAKKDFKKFISNWLMRAQGKSTTFATARPGYRR